ncbi:MAG: hypothetical protein LZF62_40016 [Nitrospira sp.]|nr:MAG: hypothetical protein LZF62_40016 [Nitrospira sp.]
MLRLHSQVLFQAVANWDAYNDEWLIE